MSAEDVEKQFESNIDVENKAVNEKEVENQDDKDNDMEKGTEKNGGIVENVMPSTTVDQLERKNSVHFDSKDQIFSQQKQVDNTPRSSFGYRRYQRRLTLGFTTESAIIWKNLLIVSFGLMGIMSAYDMLRYVETSLNSEEGLGTASLAANYTMLILSAMFGPTLLSRKIGNKWALVIAMVLFNFFFIAHFYPTFGTLIPGALIMGIGYGLIHPCSNSYVTHLAHSYADLRGIPVSGVIHYFFGIFMFIMFMARIWGNLVSSLVLTASEEPSVNATRNLVCGAHYCSESLKVKHVNVSSENMYDSPDSPMGYKAYTLYGISIGTAIVSAIMVALLLQDRREAKANEEGKEDEESTCHHVLATFRLMKQPKLILIILITMFMGLIESYMSGDYTKAFVTCSLGIHHVGFVIICYGTCASFFSYLWGWMANITGRISVFMVAAFIDIGCIFAMAYWTPDPNQPIIFYVLSGLWGVADAVWRPQLYALYGFLFPKNKEAAFGNLEIWQSVGLVIGYVWEDYVCIDGKLYILLIVLIAAMIGYLSVEFTLWSTKRKASLHK